MLNVLRGLVSAKYPFNGRLLVYGAAGGVVMGLFHLMLGKSVDEATAVGIASYVSITVGAWVGTGLAFWALRLTLSRVVAMWAPLEEVVERIPSTPEVKKPKESPAATKPGWGRQFRVWCLMDLPVILLIMLPIPVFQVLWDLQVGLYEPNFWRPIALGVGVLTLGSLAVQHGVIWFLSWRIAQLACSLEESETIETERSAPRIRFKEYEQVLMIQFETRQQGRAWEGAVRAVPNRVKWFTGVSLDPLDLEDYSGATSPVHVRPTAQL